MSRLTRCGRVQWGRASHWSRHQSALGCPAPCTQADQPRASISLCQRLWTDCRRSRRHCRPGSKLSRPGGGRGRARDRGAGLSCFLTLISPGGNYPSIQCRIPGLPGLVCSVGESRAQPALLQRPRPLPESVLPPQDRGHCRSQSTGAASRGAVPRAELPVGRARCPAPVVPVHAAACSRADLPVRSQWTGCKEAGR